MTLNINLYLVLNMQNMLINKIHLFFQQLCAILKLHKNVAVVVFLSFAIIPAGYAAIAPDRTRIIYNGSQKSVSIAVHNRNTQLAYLAQGWIEDESGNKVKDYFAVLPPVQKIGPGKESQMRIQALPSVSALPQDRESVFWFNLREIPPKSDKPNSLQIALQSRLKLFYRPTAITLKDGEKPWQEKITLHKEGDRFIVQNPTPYYVTIADADNNKGGSGIKGFEPVMIAPMGRAMLKVSSSALGNHPVLTYVNDYGGRPQLEFVCNGTVCDVKKR
ncbi:periplasmic fimbrial chaperone [Trabulsiella guamensis ATCC 49490]|uniref:Periplasmic fimbrial chaperone n=1 Tax=Trabulsiella guamensis ATCC 49490 TaxID=1005994 RepID=A0A084ZP95_9ENTR|nr:fimbria/pilus periplasmic chaperone [Trabulsiella guamensis]KFB99289.1 periplasmic fimbrial chaperone [Trabulsiella guamensis ATCC 49490]